MVERNEAEISQILEERLDSVLSGKTSLEEALRDYPQYEQELRHDLEAALWLDSGQADVRSRPGYLSASKKRVMSRIRAEAAGRSSTQGRAVQPVFPRIRFAQVFAVAMVALLVFFAGAGAVVSAAQAALPGEQLYPVKLVSENAAVSLSADEERKVELRTSFAGRRLAEAETLIENGQFDLASQAVAVYAMEVQQAVWIVQNIAFSRPQVKNAAANRLAEDLVIYTDHLETLAHSAPETMRPALTGAISASMSGAAIAGDVIEDTLEQLSAGTPTPSPEPDGQSITTPAPTGETGQPISQTQTLQSMEEVTTLTPAAEKDKKPTHTPRPEVEKKPSNTPKPENEKKPTNTPRPANENKPTSASQPSSDSSDSSEDESSKPPKEEKPPKEKKDK